MEFCAYPPVFIMLFFGTPPPHRRNAAGFRGNCIFNHPVDHLPGARHSRAMHPAPSDPLDQVFMALADPTRRAILALLLEDDMAVTDVAAAFPQSLAGISKHLAVLARCGLIVQERRGRVIWCKLDPDALRAASVWMQAFGQFEPLHLDAFERFLEQELRQAPDEPT